MTDETSEPRRIQRQRTRGWKMPPNTIYVGRPSMDGNGFRVGSDLSYYLGPAAKRATAAQCVEAHRAYLEAACASDPQAAGLMWKRLRGHNLACWCKIGSPCHADTLLELANREPTQ